MVKKAIDEVFALTVVTRGEKPGENTYWFGRRDMSDDLRPTKISATNVQKAWAQLEKHR